MQRSHNTTSMNYPAYYFARRGMWPVVYKKLKRAPSLISAVDHVEGHIGWTWLDHAVYQQRMEVIKRLQMTFKLQVFANKGPIIIHHMGLGNWLWILQLLNAKLINSNDEYCGLDGKYYTLLDIAILQNNQDIVANLRLHHGAMTVKEIDVALATRQMFAAAKAANWQEVYQLLDEQQTSVDSIDRSDKQCRVLLHLAYEQHNQPVFLKLLNHYGATLEDIRNTDPFLYFLMVDFYEAFMLPPAPIARPILPGYTKLQQATEPATERGFGISQLKLDFPNGEDVIVPYTRKRSNWYVPTSR